MVSVPHFTNLLSVEYKHQKFLTLATLSFLVLYCKKKANMKKTKKTNMVVGN